MIFSVICAVLFSRIQIHNLACSLSQTEYEWIIQYNCTRWTLVCRFLFSSPLFLTCAFSWDESGKLLGEYIMVIYVFHSLVAEKVLKRDKSQSHIVFFIVFTCCCRWVKLSAGWLVMQETEAESRAGSTAGRAAAASTAETRKVYNTHSSTREARAEWWDGYISGQPQIW